jgi:hypothetical protein
VGSVHLDGFITKKKPIYRVAQKMYTLFTHQYKGAVCILFLGHSVYLYSYGPDNTEPFFSVNNIKRVVFVMVTLFVLCEARAQTLDLVLKGLRI